MTAHKICHFFLLLMTGLLLNLVTQQTSAQVWTEANAWNEQWEKNFHTWVQKEWNAQFFSQETFNNGQHNPYFGLRTDCADTVYSMRLIFSYENKLPFAINDPTRGSKLITNKMQRWNLESREIDRVRSFLLYIYDLVSTHTLPNDTYPSAIGREFNGPGSLLMTTSLNHHSWTVQNMLAIGVPHLIFNSTIGSTSSSKLMERTSWPNPLWVFEGNFTPTGNAGFRYWRKIQDLQKPVWLAEGYSEEQYQFPLNQWVKVVQKKLALTEEPDLDKISRLMETVCAGAQGRVSAVNEGLDFLATLGDSCMTYDQYDTYSTPNRDQRVFDDFISLRRAYFDLVKNRVSLPIEIVQQLTKIFPNITLTTSAEHKLMKPQTITPDSYCLIQAGDRQIDLAEFKRRLFDGLMSNNPNESTNYRWGELRGPSPRGKSCESWDLWTPNLDDQG